MKAIAIKGMIRPLLITWLCFIFLIPNNVMAQNKQGKNGKKVRVERTVTANHDKKGSMLTDDQKTKIKDLRSDHMKAIRLLKSQSAELVAHLKTLNLAENPDNKAIFATVDEMMANRGEMMKRMISFKQAFKEILTPEQMKALQMREMNKRSRMGEGNQNWGHQGRRNMGRGQMAQRGGMNRQGQMMNQGQMRQGQMRQGQMMNRRGQGAGGRQMMQPGQMNRRMQMNHQKQMNPSDSTIVK